MHTNKLLAAIAFGVGLTLTLLWLLGATFAAAAPSADFVVTKLTDSADGVCDADCSLREAIIAANENDQPNTIELGNGNYVLSLTSGSSEPERDDLNILSSYALTITGNGPQNTFINANGIDGVLYINAGVPTVVISGVTLYGGISSGIYHRGGDLILINTAVISNTASSGGGIHLRGADAFLTLGADCLLARNEADYGGGISIVSGARAQLVGGRIVSNTAIYGGGVHVDKDELTISGTQIVSNTATYGGGIFLKNDAVLNKGAILSNTASSSGGGVFVSTGTFTQTV
jgi:CSLREA domain-containing protein